MALLELQVHAVIAFPAREGDNVTTKSLAAKISPLTITAPEVAPTDNDLARPVAVKPAAQVLKSAALVDTASVTQVRAPLAAKMTSEALARLV